MRLWNPRLKCEGCTQFAGHGGPWKLHEIAVRKAETGRDDHPCSSCPLYEARTDEGWQAQKLPPMASLAVELEGMMTGDDAQREVYRLTPYRVKFTDAMLLLPFIRQVSEIKAEYRDWRASQPPEKS